MGDYIFLVDNLIGYKADGTELHYVEIAGNSGGTKPLKSSNGEGAICSGSICAETDTGKVSFYDETGGWTEQFSFQG